MSEENDMYIIEEETDLGKPMGFLERFISIFIAPGKLAENISNFPKLGAASVYILILSILAVFVSLQATPIITDAQSLVIAERYGVDFLNLSASTAAVQQNGVLTGVIGYGSVVSVMFISCALSAVGMIILTKIFRGNATFKHYFSFALHMASIGLIGSIIISGITILTGSTINFLSLAPIFAPKGNFTMPMFNFFSSIEVFGIWSAIITAIGIKKMNYDFSMGKAITISVILFVLSVGFSTAAASSSVLIYDMTYQTIQSAK